MIEYVTLDYDGEPVTIEDGEILDAEPPKEVWSDYKFRYMTEDEGDIFWDSEALDWKIEVCSEYAPLDKDEYDYWCER